MPAGRKRDASGLDPLRPFLGHSLLVDHLALDPVRKAAQLRRPLVERAHDPLPDREVVLDQVSLRLLPRRKEHLVGVRHLDGAAADVELDEGDAIAGTVPLRGTFEAVLQTGGEQRRDGHAQGSDSARRGRAGDRGGGGWRSRRGGCGGAGRLRQGQSGSGQGWPALDRHRQSCLPALVRRRQTKGRPWKINDPAKGQGFESAVAYAVAKRLGFTRSAGRLGLHALRQGDRAGQEVVRLRHQPDLATRRSGRRSSPSAPPTTTSTSRSSASRASRSPPCARSTA